MGSKWKTFMGRKEKTIFITIIANIILIVLRFFLANLSGSIGLTANAWHSFTDVFVSTVVFIGLMITHAGAEKLGKTVEKIEHILAIFVAIFIFYMGIEILEEALSSNAAELRYVPFTAAGAFLGVVINYFMARLKIYVGEQTGSQSLLADGYHSKMDMYCSIAVLVGIVGALFGMKSLDKVAAICAMVLLMSAGYEILTSNIRALMHPNEEHEGHMHSHFSFHKNKKAIVGITGVLVGAYIFSGIYIVQIDEAGIVKRFGAIVKDNVAPGIHYSLPAPFDEVIALDAEVRAAQQEADEIRANRNKISKEIGALMGQGKKEEAEAKKAEVAANAARLAELEEKENELREKIKKDMMTIPNIIDPSVPIGKDDSENVEIQKYGEPVVPDFEIPYHTEIMEKFHGIDMDAAGRVAGNGFYYLMGDIARLHSAVLAYARDFMINRGFTYCVPPFMIRSAVVDGVMSFAEMDAMMYKIEGEDLYLIGTSEHSMIGKFIDTIIPETELPKTLTSYSPCFRKEKGAHGLEERGVYRIHQFEKQEMIVVCKPEESAMWFDKLWQNTVDLFRSMDIPVRTIECCSGDLADLKVKSYDVEAWSPRQKKYFEVGSCSNLGDAQARRLKIRVNGENGKYFAHTLNNTVVAPPRMLIAFLENNLQADGSVKIPEVLQPYMGGMTEIR